jgi:hypothetical protein
VRQFLFANPSFLSSKKNEVTMKNNLRGVLATCALSLTLLFAAVSSSAQNTVLIDGLCVGDGITLDYNGDLNGKAWYTGIGDVLGFSGVFVDLYWDDIDATWYLAFDGQPYFANPDDTPLPPPTYNPGWLPTVDNFDCTDGEAPLSVTGDGTEGGGDSDDDGTPDALDGCPDDPNKTAPGACGCGVADTDTDEDGTADCNDGCSDDPNKTAPGACGCGVADTDTDEDGTADCNDGCPDDPNKTAPGACGCGVADTDLNDNGTVDCLEIADADNDGIPDENDNCPTQANADQTDSDCDGVGDVCDLCPGGDDSVDNNNDGLPDCKYPPAYADIITDWKCGNGDNQKVSVCHKGRRTICVSYAALAAHLGHGDFLGPCGNASCNGERSDNSVSTATTLYPNPASSEVRLDLSDHEGEVVSVRILDVSGVLARDFNQIEIGHESVRLDLSGLAEGMYFIQAQPVGEAAQMMKLVIQQ